MHQKDRTAWSTVIFDDAFLCVATRNVACTHRRLCDGGRLCLVQSRPGRSTRKYFCVCIVTLLIAAVLLELSHISHTKNVPWTGILSATSVQTPRNAQHGLRDTKTASARVDISNYWSMFLITAVISWLCLENQIKVATTIVFFQNQVIYLLLTTVWDILVVQVKVTVFLLLYCHYHTSDGCCDASVPFPFWQCYNETQNQKVCIVQL